MTCEELAKKALNHVVEMEIPVHLYASEGCACGDGWDDEIELILSRTELIYLIHQHIGYDSLFKDIEETKIDINQKLNELAYEGAWDGQTPTGNVNETIPDELYHIAEKLESLDTNNKVAIEKIQEELRTISDGNYTFCFSVECNGYYFSEEATETLELTADEVLGLLYGNFNLPEVFSIFNVSPLDEEFINQKAEQKEFACDYDYFDYGGDSDALDNYLDAWKFIFEQIFKEKIDEDSLDSWLTYFEDSDNLESYIQDWHQ